MHPLNTQRSSTLRKLHFTASRAAYSQLVAGLAIVVALCFFAVSARAADVLRLASTYNAVGKNGDGSVYKGTVSIKIISDTTFSIEWKIGNSVIKGFGMRMNENLSATYTLDGQPGLVMYKVQDDGSLAGIWAIEGQPGNGSEVLTPK